MESSGAGGGFLIGGRYDLGQKLGQGGMGAVYRAVDTRTGRVVALKLLLEVDEKSLARFRREARAAASLRHPHIVGLLDMDIDNPNGAYIVMELVDGVSLHTLLAQAGRLDEPRAVAIASQLYSALAHAHAAGLLHRDVKPGNILISKTDTIPDYLRLVDFGLAKHEDPQQGGPAVTTMSSMLGTPAYMPPEQMIGSSLDARADIYSAGLVLYQMIAGVDPYTATGSERISDVLAQRSGRPLLSVAQWASPEIAALVDACIAPDRSHRPGSAAQVVERLARRSSGSALRARPHPVLDASAVATVGPPPHRASAPSLASPAPVTGGYPTTPSFGADPGAATALPGSLHHQPTVGGPAPVALTVAQTGYGPTAGGAPALAMGPQYERAAPSARAGRGLVIAVAALAVLAIGALGIAGAALYLNRQPTIATAVDAQALAAAASPDPAASGATRATPSAAAIKAPPQRSAPRAGPSSPNTLAPSPPTGAATGAGSCICADTRGSARFCAAAQEPVCSCGGAICKVSFVPTADGRSSTCPGGFHNFGGPGKKTGQACTGFGATFTSAGAFASGANPRSGELACSVCETPTRMPGVQGGRCTGVDNLGKTVDGIFVDCR